MDTEFETTLSDPNQLPNEGEVANETEPQPQGVCNFFLSARGCLKGERCQFFHDPEKKANKEADVMNEKKLCDFYLSPNGCLKEERCDFLHPKAPNGTVTKRICDFFSSPRGCSKTDHCDFLHIQKPKQPMQFNPLASMNGRPQRFPQHMGMPNLPRAPMFNSPQIPMLNMIQHQQLQAAQHRQLQAAQHRQLQAAQHRQLQAALNRPMRSSKNGRICSFYQTSRGCAKGERCEFEHVPSGVPKLPSIDSLYGNTKHRFQTPLPHFNNGLGPENFMMRQDVFPRGNIFPGGNTGLYQRMRTQSQGSYGKKICSFFMTARGCRKGDRCDFIHPADDGNKLSGGNRYVPY